MLNNFQLLNISLLFLREKFEEVNNLLNMSLKPNHYKNQLLILYPYMNVPQTVHYLKA